MMSRGVDLYVSDIHGEFDMFSHVLKSGCGAVNRAVDMLFADELGYEECDELSTLICYPAEKLPVLMDAADDQNAWAEATERRLRKVYDYFAESAASGKTMGHPTDPSIAVRMLCLAIQRLAVKRLYMLGDVYDRGPAPDRVVDALMDFHSTELIWGNHDMLWMGAAMGQIGCICTVVRICARYGNLSVLEDTYGMDLSELTRFAYDAYGDDPCAAFGLKGGLDVLSESEVERHIKVQKAMALIQFKVEARLIDENPSFGLEDRKLLHRIDFEKGTIELDGVEHELTDAVFPTVDPDDPYRLTAEEEHIISFLEAAFAGCARLHEHLSYFTEHGSLYKICGNDLLIHACVPLNEDGSLKEVALFGNTFKGKALFDEVERRVRDAADGKDPEAHKQGLDLIWYLWLGEGSPLFAKSKMATFELYFVTDKAARTEVKNAFYSLLGTEGTMDVVFTDFGMDPAVSTILCGHVPVKVKDGEDPVKCGGKLIDLDGGMSKPYRSKSGLSGMALIDDADIRMLALLDPLPEHDELLASNSRLTFEARKIER